MNASTDLKKVSKSVAMYVGKAEGSGCQNRDYTPPFQQDSCTAWISQVEDVYQGFEFLGLQTNISLFSFSTHLNFHTAGSYLVMLPVLLRTLYRDTNFPNADETYQVPFSNTLFPFPCALPTTTPTTTPVTETTPVITTTIDDDDDPRQI